MQKLRYTGHPFVDVGVAAITAYAERTTPEEVTGEDLERIADFIHRNYPRPPLRGHLTMAFTSNAWFIQPSFGPEERDYWGRQHLYQWQATETSQSERCVFTGEPAIAANLSKSLQESRVGRAQMPLLQGDVAINFFPYGEPGLPISGRALLALQFFPLGCAKQGLGKDVGLLAVHSDNNYLTYEITSKFFHQNMAAFLQARVAEEARLPTAQHSLKTHLIETLLEIERKRSRIERDQEPASLTVYKFNNGKDVGLEMHHLPLEVMAFIRGAQANYRESWEQLEQRGWQLGYKGKGQQKEISDTHRQWSNRLYEDLFDLPQASHRFIRLYFLQAVDQESGEETRPVLWPLIVFFLREVVHMNQAKADKIKEFGDRLTDYIMDTQGKRFLRDVRTAKDYAQFRQRLIYALEKAVRDNHLLISFDDYVAIFEDDSEEFHGWKLARDLLVIRIIEQLHQKRASEVIEEVAEDQEDL